MNVQDMKTRLLSLVETFKEKESELTDLDRAIGDGDHGVNMVRGFEALEQGLDDTDMKSLFKSTGMTLMSKWAVPQVLYTVLALLKWQMSLKMILTKKI